MGFLGNKKKSSTRRPEEQVTRDGKQIAASSVDSSDTSLSAAPPEGRDDVPSAPPPKVPASPKSVKSEKVSRPANKSVSDNKSVRSAKDTGSIQLNMKRSGSVRSPRATPTKSEGAKKADDADKTRKSERESPPVAVEKEKTVDKSDKSVKSSKKTVEKKPATDSDKTSNMKETSKPEKGAEKKEDRKKPPPSPKPKPSKKKSSTGKNDDKRQRRPSSRRSSSRGRRGRMDKSYSDESREVELSDSEDESVDSDSSYDDDESKTDESAAYDTYGSGSFSDDDCSKTQDSVTADPSESFEESLDTDNRKVAHNMLERRGVVDPSHQAIVQVNEYGSVEKLLLQELCHIPQVKKPDDVIIKVECSTISLQDCMIRRGKWYEMQSLPFVPGSDIVGTVHELGVLAQRKGGLNIGERVAAVVPSGGNAKYITVPYESLFRVPPDVDPVVALCISSTYVPAREALDLARKLNTPLTGANILIIGGNGPSGLATIELCMLEGANVFTTADERHHEYLANLGAKCFPIDPAKWLPQIRGKMDVVLDSVCLDSYESSLLALNPEGTLVCTGLSAVYTQGQIRAYGLKDVRDFKAMYVKLRAKFMMNQTVYYDRLQRYDNAPNEYAQHFRYLCHLVSRETIKPTVSARASLNMVAFMHKAIEHGNTPYGVCVCTPWSTRSEM